MPIGHLWLPYLAVRGIWRASSAPPGQRVGPVLARWLLFNVARWSALLTGGLPAALVSVPEPQRTGTCA